MSTTPTEILETVSETLETIASTVPTAADPTAAAESSFSIESIKELMDGFDPAALLPELDTIFGKIELVCRIAVIAGPIVLLVLGLSYLFFSPKEANYYFGYRCYFGMGSVHAWRFTQRLAGIVLGVLGLILAVTMVLITGDFRQMEMMDMVWKAVRCLAWEAVLALVATFGINLAAAMRFDRKGEYRKKKAKK